MVESTKHIYFVDVTMSSFLIHKVISTSYTFCVVLQCLVIHMVTSTSYTFCIVLQCLAFLYAYIYVSFNNV